MINRLNEVNDIKIYSVYSDEFKSFGRVIDCFDTSSLIKYMKDNTTIPSDGNVYFTSIKEMEELPIKKEIENVIYGNMPIQIGYCNGKNSTYNGFEYHKCSELNIAVTSFMLVLGHVYDIKDNTYKVGQEKVFFVKEGTMIEMFSTTLHLSPCKVNKDGFKCVVILLKGTNEELDYKLDSKYNENKLLLKKNKWILAHKDRDALVKQGAYIGLIGENKKLNY